MNMSCFTYSFFFTLFRLTFEEVVNKEEKKSNEAPTKKVIVVEPHVIPSRGPYLFNEPKK